MPLMVRYGCPGAARAGAKRARQLPETADMVMRRRAICASSRDARGSTPSQQRRRGAADMPTAKDMREGETRRSPIEIVIFACRRFVYYFLAIDTVATMSKMLPISLPLPDAPYV